jgi:hypothetical protein
MSPFERLRGAHLTAHPVLEDFIFSVLSIMVLVVAIVAVAMPQNATVTAAMAAPLPATKNHAVFYGTLVDASGQPIVGAQIVIKDELGNVMASTTSDAAGEWDVRFRDERNMPKTYTLEVTTYVNGQPVTGTTELTASTGKMWGVQLVFTQPSTWVFVPLPGY